jgi:biotin operon repressor
MTGPVQTIAERILRALNEAGKPLDDDELAATLGVRRQAINQECRRLASQSRLVRQVSVGNKIQNVTTGSPPAIRPEPAIDVRPGDVLKEDEVKAAVRDHLRAEGYDVTVAWGHERGIDIEARKPGDRILIEAKGEVARQPQQVNYFLGALGELVQRLADPNARYGLALPDNRQYRGLVERLPAFARRQLRLWVYFVSRSADGYRVKEA